VSLETAWRKQTPECSTYPAKVSAEVYDSSSNTNTMIYGKRTPARRASLWEESEKPPVGFHRAEESLRAVRRLGKQEPWYKKEHQQNPFHL